VGFLLLLLLLLLLSELGVLCEGMWLATPSVTYCLAVRALNHWVSGYVKPLKNPHKVQTLSLSHLQRAVAPALWCSSMVLGTPGSIAVVFVRLGRGGGV